MNPWMLPFKFLPSDLINTKVLFAGAKSVAPSKITRQTSCKPSRPEPRRFASQIHKCSSALSKKDVRPHVHDQPDLSAGGSMVWTSTIKTLACLCHWLVKRRVSFKTGSEPPLGHNLIHPSPVHCQSDRYLRLSNPPTRVSGGWSRQEVVKKREI